MSSTTFTITRELPDESRDIEIDVDFDYSAYGISYIASDIDGNQIQLTDGEREALYDKIREEAWDEWN